MTEIHCHVCGGFIGDSTSIDYRLPLDTGHSASPRSALCDCQPPIVYAAPPGHASLPSMPAVSRVSV